MTEDFNGDARLQPGNVDLGDNTTQTTTASATGIARTGTDGRATITLLYAESYVSVGEGQAGRRRPIVSGTESSTEAQFVVDGPRRTSTARALPPAGWISPFGVNDCATPN